VGSAQGGGEGFFVGGGMGEERGWRGRNAFVEVIQDMVYGLR
jgi:hypothetical protein